MNWKLIGLTGIILLIAAFWRLSSMLKITRETYDTSPAIISVLKTARPESYTTWHWERAASSTPWSPRDAHAWYVWDDTLWMLGGLNGNPIAQNDSVEYWNAPHFAEIWKTKDGTTWSLVTARGSWGPRRSMEIETFRDKLWMLGGWNKVHGYQDDIWYSNDGASWMRATSTRPFTPREGHGVAVMNNTLVLAGGVQFDDRSTKNDVWLSSDGTTWKEALEHAPWSPRYDHTLTTFENKLWIIGGIDLKKDIKQDIWTSDDGISWKLLSDTPPWPARHGHSTFVFDNKLWIIGGWGKAGGLNDTWFTSDGITWHALKTAAPWIGREDHTATVFHDTIWMAGGMDNVWHWNNDLWHLVP